ncbi:MAG: hypothetical protein AB7P24_05135 [Nitrospira sp.]
MQAERSVMKKEAAEAEQWLRDIHGCISHDNPTAATRTVEAIYRKAGLESFLDHATGRDETKSSTSISLLFPASLMVCLMSIATCCSDLEKTH